MGSSLRRVGSRAILATSDAEWQRVKPMTGAADDAELERLRDWYRRGIPRDWGEPERHAATQLFELLAKIGGPDLVGPISTVPSGTFWPVTWRAEPSVPHTTRTANAACLRRGVPARLADRRGSSRTVACCRQSPPCSTRWCSRPCRAHCRGTLRSLWAASPPPSRCRCCWAAGSASPWVVHDGSTCGWTIP